MHLHWPEVPEPVTSSKLLNSRLSWGTAKWLWNYKADECCQHCMNMTSAACTFIRWKKPVKQRPLLTIYQHDRSTSCYMIHLIYCDVPYRQVELGRAKASIESSSNGHGHSSIMVGGSTASVVTSVTPKQGTSTRPSPVTTPGSMSRSSSNGNGMSRLAVPPRAPATWPEGV
jgi:hypothetical protein